MHGLVGLLLSMSITVSSETWQVVILDVDGVVRLVEEVLVEALVLPNPLF